MKILNRQLLVLLFAGSVVATVSADPVDPVHRAPPSTLASYVEAHTLAGLEPMDHSQMAATEGALWPLIGTIVALDLALQSYFWGVYVPSQTPAPCITCRTAVIRQ